MFFLTQCHKYDSYNQQREKIRLVTPVKREYVVTDPFVYTKPCHNVLNVCPIHVRKLDISFLDLPKRFFYIMAENAMVIIL